MKNKYLRVILTVLLPGLCALWAGAGGFEEDFNKRRSSLRDASCLEIFNDTTLQGEELEAMKFLYAYLPLPDLASYPPEFFRANVEATLRARREMPWGNTVPEREFRHFVLPLRVNNEMLDSARILFYEELKPRLEGLSMKEGVLEVNHWCHEKVSYHPSDPRTSNPLSAVSQAIGRCGEESTFTVAALRAVGIPARQVYTPRWAHTDDNHAWVEAWADGEWHFIGACEPEPILDLAWFNLPASRGLLMHTNVFGKYDGPEEKIAQSEVTTTINVTENYAPTSHIRVKVRDEAGAPVEGATVNFCIYNYADFFPVSTQKTGADAMAGIACGLGDMVVWATDGKRYGFIVASPSEEKVWELALDKDMNFAGEFELDIVPPAQSRAIPEVDADSRNANNARLAEEDRIRKGYTATFFTEQTAREYAAGRGWTPERVAPLLVKSRGNHATLLEFLNAVDGSQFETALSLLEAINEKDLRDVTLEVLVDNIENFEGDATDGVCAAYLLNPRVEFEPLTPYKSFFREHIDAETVAKTRENPETWVEWVRGNIAGDTVWNPQAIHMTPVPVWNQRMADMRSANIFLVATLRSMGVPARIESVTGKTQYFHNGNWRDVSLGSEAPGEMQEAGEGKGFLTLLFNDGGSVKRPVYFSHFALHRIDAGLPRQLEFEEGSTVSDLGENIELDAGTYMLVTGQRVADGSVLVKGNIFAIEAGNHYECPVELRQDDSKISVIGSFDSETLYRDLASGVDKSILSTTGRGYYVLGIIKANDEPSAHALNDISSRRNDFESRPEKIIVLFSDSDQASRFDFGRFGNLPATLSFGVDSGSQSLSQLVESLSLSDASLPVFVIADSFNRVVYVSQGYTIGLGDKLLDVLNVMEK